MPIDWSQEPDPAKGARLNTRATTKAQRGLSSGQLVPHKSGFEEYWEERGAKPDFSPQDWNPQSSRPTQTDRGLAYPKSRIPKPIRVERIIFDDGDTIVSDLPILASPPPKLKQASVRTYGQQQQARYKPRKDWPGNYPSFELKGPDPHTNNSEQAVAYWLHLHKDEILGAAQEWRVDPRAIAGAIAWEALENPRSWSIRASGPGKVHSYDFLPYNESWAEFAELFNPKRLPRLTSSDRDKVLETSGGSITYIGAIMDTIARIAEYNGWDVRQNPAILTYAYQARNLKTWKATVSEKKKTDSFMIPEQGMMASWVQHHLGYLARALR